MKTVCLLSILAVETFAADRMSAREEPVTIDVRICNYAAIPGAELRRAEEEVVRVLGGAGVYTRFVDCPPPAADSEADREDKPGLQPVEVTIRLRPGLPARELVSSGMVFGFAFLPRDGSPGTLADVYAGGAEVLAKGLHALGPLILGALISHEIGHLLLGVSEHSLGGLMCSPWGTVEKNRIAQGSLRFHDGEGRKMRANCRTHPGRRTRWRQPLPISPRDT